jgi:PAS domain S-box-containing protein
MHVMDLLDSQNLGNTLQAELMQLRRFFELSLDPLAISDEDACLKRLNPAMERVLGYSQDELLSRSMVDFVHPDDRAATRAELARLRDGSPVSYFENRYRTKAGEVVWLAWSCIPVPEEGLFYAVARDITAQKRTQDRLRNQQQVLAELMRLPAMQGGDLQGAMRAISEAAARAMGVARVSIWCYDEEKSRIVCRDLFEAETGAHRSGDVLLASEHPVYFQALATERLIAADDARVDPRTREFDAGYFAAHGITSMLDVPLRIGGEVSGILCHEHIGPKRHWTAEEETFAAALGDALALACETHERHMAQEALEQSEARFRYVAFATMDALYDWNIRTGEFWWSDGLLKVSPSAGLADSFGIDQWREHLHPEDRERIWSSLRVALAQKVPYWTEEYRFLRENDGYATIRERGYVLRDAEGQAIRMIGAMEDITDRRRAEEERARSLAREASARGEVEAIKELNRLKNQFVNAVSHDLRVPLTSVMGYAEFLEDGIGGMLTPQQTVFVDQIQKNALRLARLVDDLLDFARMEAGTLKLNLEEADLAGRLCEVAQSLKPQIEAAGLTLDLDLGSESIPACVDVPRIERVFFNLINNAIKFTAAGGAIRVSLTTDSDGIRAEVRDTGVGIAAEDLPKLFRPFSQLVGSQLKGGTGLGLNIVKLLVEAHGGSVGVSSELGRGSCFWFTLPERACAQPELPLLLDA